MVDIPKVRNPILKGFIWVVLITTYAYYLTWLGEILNQALGKPWGFVISAASPFLLALIFHLTSGYRFSFSIQKKDKTISSQANYNNPNFSEFPTDGIGHIKYFWEKRDNANHDIIQTLTKCTLYSEIFVSGIGLGTMQNAFSDQAVIDNIVNCITHNSSPFKLIILFPLKAENSIRPEITAISLDANINHGHNIIQTLIGKIKEKIPQSINLGKFIELKNYNIEADGSSSITHKVIPRHFLLSIDNNIYVGPYLAQKEGKNSFLMKLEKPNSNISQEGMYNIYLNEIEYLIANSRKTTLINI